MARKALKDLPEHSPLGFSGAERYMVCPGSVALNMSLPADTILPDPEYRIEGTRAHHAAARCLLDGADAWEMVEHYPEMRAAELDAVQVYLDHVREIEAIAGHVYERLVEVKIHAPELHEQAWSTLDYALVLSDKRCIIRDYKHGEGMFVDAEHNPQLLGYAGLMLERFPWITEFSLGIVQPRFADESKVRTWLISADEIRYRLTNQLVPAMRNAWSMTKGKPPVYQPGDHCRFCPAKDANVCPALRHDLAVVEQSAPMVERVSDERLAELYGKVEPMKMVLKAIEAETARRALAGIKLPGVKVVSKRAFRVWKSDAEAALRAAYGTDAYKTELVGPATIEDMRDGKAFVKRWAYTPDNGYTVAPESDRRKAVEVQKPSETFAFVVDNSGEKV